MIAWIRPYNIMVGHSLMSTELLGSAESVLPVLLVASGACIVGFFDSIEEMRAVDDVHRGHTGLKVNES